MASASKLVCVRERISSHSAQVDLLGRLKRNGGAAQSMATAPLVMGSRLGCERAPRSKAK